MPNSPARFLVNAKVWLEHERGPEPNEAEIAQAVADRLGDGAYGIHVVRKATFAGARMIPTATEADPALSID